MKSVGYGQQIQGYGQQIQGYGHRQQVGYGQQNPQSYFAQHRLAQQLPIKNAYRYKLPKIRNVYDHETSSGVYPYPHI